MLNESVRLEGAGAGGRTRHGRQLCDAIARHRVRQGGPSGGSEIARGNGRARGERQHHELKERERDERLDERECGAVAHTPMVPRAPATAGILSLRGGAVYSRPYSLIL